MVTIKSFTSLEQSKVLAKILSLESADMCYEYDEYADTKYCHIPTIKIKEFEYKSSIPCWSLAALLEQLPYELCDDDGNSVYLQINKEDDMYQLVYEDHCLYGDFENIETDKYEHFVDACVNMIIRLHELNLL